MWQKISINTLALRDAQIYELPQAKRATKSTITQNVQSILGGSAHTGATMPDSHEVYEASKVCIALLYTFFLLLVQ